MIDIYESAVEATVRFGAVFERDDETAFFYLIDTQRSEGNQIVSVVEVRSANNMSSDFLVSVRWSEFAAIVGLFINRNFIAVFDLRSESSNGRYADAADACWF